jgi:hypothetical protein
MSGELRLVLQSYLTGLPLLGPPSLDQPRPGAKAGVHPKDDGLTRLKTSRECDLRTRDQLHLEEEALPAFPCKPT